MAATPRVAASRTCTSVCAIAGVAHANTTTTMMPRVKPSGTTRQSPIANRKLDVLISRRGEECPLTDSSFALNLRTVARDVRWTTRGCRATTLRPTTSRSPAPDHPPSEPPRVRRPSSSGSPASAWRRIVQESGRDQSQRWGAQVRGHSARRIEPGSVRHAANTGAQSATAATAMYNTQITTISQGPAGTTPA